MAAPQHTLPTQILDRFCVAGINYHEADTTVRGSFSISRELFAEMAIHAKGQNIRSMFVLSTCNRTEIYGFTEDVMILVQLLTRHTKGDTDTFLRYAYTKNGEEALQHLYEVASGLDSQILGDYEVLGQMKQAVDLSTAAGLVGPIMNRTVNYAFQASKKIKTDTGLSSGTVSVSYAAIELLRNLGAISDAHIVVVGAGKFGGNVCKNLREYLPAAGVTLLNRTDETAMAMAERTGVAFASYHRLADEIRNASIIIVCTNAQEPTIFPEFFHAGEEKLIIDLSVPVNVDPSVKAIPGIRVIDVDEISTTILDKTFARRKGEVPRAQQILQHYKTEYLAWLEEYRYSLHLKSWKDKLQELDEWQPQQFCELAGDKPLLSDNRKAQKAVTRLAVNLRTNQEKGCQFINAINDYLQMS